MVFIDDPFDFLDAGVDFLRSDGNPFALVQLYGLGTEVKKHSGSGRRERPGESRSSRTDLRRGELFSGKSLPFGTKSPPSRPDDLQKICEDLVREMRSEQSQRKTGTS